MGMKAWHLKTAMVLAGQLPDGADDQRLVLNAMRNLIEGYLNQAAETATPMAANVLPFTG